MDAKQYGLFEYPEIRNNYECPSILGDGGPTRSPADLLLSRANGMLGAAKQVRLWILVFKNKPMQAGIDQEAYWQGGNKNEFVVTIGVDDAYAVQWCHVFSWTEKADLKADAQEMIAYSGTLDLVRIVTWLEPHIAERFVRKPFAEFNYLTVELPMGKAIFVYILTLIFNLIASLVIIGNETNDE